MSDEVKNTETTEATEATTEKKATPAKKGVDVAELTAKGKTIANSTLKSINAAFTKSLTKGLLYLQILFAVAFVGACLSGKFFTMLIVLICAALGVIGARGIAGQLPEVPEEATEEKAE